MGDYFESSFSYVLQVFQCVFQPVQVVAVSGRSSVQDGLCMPAPVRVLTTNRAEKYVKLASP
jgi:hypothetical protein